MEKMIESLKSRLEKCWAAKQPTHKEVLDEIRRRLGRLERDTRYSDTVYRFLNLSGTDDGKAWKHLAEMAMRNMHERHQLPRDVQIVCDAKDDDDLSPFYD